MKFIYTPPIYFVCGYFSTMCLMVWICRQSQKGEYFIVVITFTQLHNSAQILFKETLGNHNLRLWIEPLIRCSLLTLLSFQFFFHLLSILWVAFFMDQIEFLDFSILFGMSLLVCTRRVVVYFIFCNILVIATSL